MAKAIYTGVGNVAHKVKKLYVGVDGKARKVKKAYVGVNGVARQFYSADATWAKYSVQKNFYTYEDNPTHTYSESSSASSSYTTGSAIDSFPRMVDGWTADNVIATSYSFDTNTGMYNASGMDISATTLKATPSSQTASKNRSAYNYPYFVPNSGSSAHAFRISFSSSISSTSIRQSLYWKGYTNISAGLQTLYYLGANIYGDNSMYSYKLYTYSAIVQSTTHNQGAFIEERVLPLALGEQITTPQYNSNYNMWLLFSRYSKGSSQGTTVTAPEGTYPDSGESGGVWYEKIS